MQRIGFRVPDELLAEAQRRADIEGLSVGVWVRKLMEQATGIKVEVKLGIGAADERTRRRVEKARLKGIHKRAKENSDGK